MINNYYFVLLCTICMKYYHLYYIAIKANKNRGVLVSCLAIHYTDRIFKLCKLINIYIYIQHLVGGFNVPKKCQCGSSFHFFMELKHVFNHQGSSKHHSIIFHGLRFCSFTVFHRGLVSRTLPCVKAKLNYSRYIKVYELSCNYRYKLYIRLYKYIAELLLL